MYEGNMKKLIYIVLAVVIAVVSALVINRMGVNSSDLPVEDDAASIATEQRTTESGRVGDEKISMPVRTDSDGKLGEYEQRIRELEARLAAAEESKPAKSTEKSFMSNVAEMMSNPEMKEMIRAQQMTGMEISHGALFNYLDLDAEEMKTFKELLIDKQLALMDVGFAMMNAETSNEERKDIAMRMKSINDEHEKKFREFLGDEDFDVYKQYEDTQQERMSVNLFKQSLDRANPLGEDQEHQLILAMHELRKNHNFTHDLDSQETFDPSLFTEKILSSHLNETANLHEQFVNKARGILSEAQLAKFTASLQQQRAIQEMGMKMARQMFGEE